MSKRVLIIEDNPDILDAIALLLRAEGFNIYTAENCASGFEKLIQYQPDLVITDLMLPDYSGLEFIRWVRKMKGFTNTPVIAMSAFQRGYLVAAIELGADAVIHKPEDLDNLTTTIDKVITSSAKKIAIH